MLLLPLRNRNSHYTPTARFVAILHLFIISLQFSSKSCSSYLPSRHKGTSAFTLASSKEITFATLLLFDNLSALFFPSALTLQRTRPAQIRRLTMLLLLPRKVPMAPSNWIHYPRTLRMSICHRFRKLGVISKTLV